MKSVYTDSALPEKETKIRCHFKEGIMMENAASALENAVLNYGDTPSVLILCGGGNNGGDGLALARKIYGKCRVSVLLVKMPQTEEARAQYETAKAVGVPFIDASSVMSEYTVFVDCMFGAGFHGELPPDILTLLHRVNAAKGIKIACDIPSGIDKTGCITTRDDNGSPVAFCADRTITMGALKTALFSDEAKDFVGVIEKADLGVSAAVFEKNSRPDAYLIEECDISLPHRTQKSAHKGIFGHTAVVAGEKTGAAVIAGTAALQFGSGLVTCVFPENEIPAEKNASFIMSPELMTSSSFPEKTTSVLLGSGFGTDRTNTLIDTISFICKMKEPAAVLDADFFSYPECSTLLEKLNSLENARIIITPHPKELCSLINTCFGEKNEVSFVAQHRFEFVHRWSGRFPNIVLAAKGANTFIAKNSEFFICDCGTNALAKAGSGDVLAGMCAALLAQKYSALDAAKTAVFAHASASNGFEPDYALTPLSLIEKIAYKNHRM